MRTVPDISEQLLPLDEAIDKLIKVLFNDYEFNSVERRLWSLPVRKGGLGLLIPSKISDEEYQYSRLVNESLIKKVCEQDVIYEDQGKKMKKVKNEIKKGKEIKSENELKTIKQEIKSQEKLRALEASMEKGASSWLNALPLKIHGYALDKQAFWDSLFIRYNLPLPRLPSVCVCGNSFTIEHALNCKKGGFVSLRHNDVRRITAELLNEVCIDVKEEPLLQEITGEIFNFKSTNTDKDARVDVSARNFWMRGQKAFCDVRVFNPLAKCYRTKTLDSIHLSNEREKKRKYGQRILEVDHGTFTPLVFSCFGGMSR